MRLRETHNGLQLPVFFSSFSLFSNVIRNIVKFGTKKYFTDHRTANLIYGFRDSVPVLKIHDYYYDTQKFEQHFIPIQAIATRREQCRCKQPTSNNFETLKTVAIHLLKLYNKSIIILLKKVLANICSQISKIRLILWMV